MEQNDACTRAYCCSGGCMLEPTAGFKSWSSHPCRAGHRASTLAGYENKHYTSRIRVLKHKLLSSGWMGFQQGPHCSWMLTVAAAGTQREWCWGSGSLLILVSEWQNRNLDTGDSNIFSLECNRSVKNLSAVICIASSLAMRAPQPRVHACVSAGTKEYC